MSPEQARDLQTEMERLSKRILAGHAAPDDVLMISKTLAEVLAHLAWVMESRSKIPRKAP